MFSALGAYGSLFGAAFLAATILPAQSELLLVYLLRSGTHDWSLLLLVATIGNVLGSILNWFVGRWIEQFRGKRWFPVSTDVLERAEHWYSRWGKWSLLLSWAPVFGDALTIVAGMLRTSFIPFMALVLVAKIGLYMALALAVSASV